LTDTTQNQSNTVSVNPDGGTTSVSLTFTTNQSSLSDNVTMTLNVPNQPPTTLKPNPTVVSCNQTVTPTLAVTKTCSVALNTCALNVNYTGTVKNTGNVALLVSMTDTHGFATDTPFEGTSGTTPFTNVCIPAGTTLSFFGSYGTTATDLKTVFDDTASASGTAVGGASAGPATNLATCALCP
jgi:hypothetical protein